MVRGKQVNTTVDEYAKGFQEGATQQREHILRQAENRICFDHKATGTCDHGGCWALQDLINKIRGLTDGDS